MLTATCYDYIKTYLTHYNWIEDNSEFIFAARSRSLHKLGKKEYIRGVASIFKWDMNFN